MAQAISFGTDGWRAVIADGFTFDNVRGVMVTASHNPAKYNGLKFKAWYGGSALPETYSAIAGALGKREARDGGTVSDEDLLDDYIAALRGQVGRIDLRI